MRTREIKAMVNYLWIYLHELKDRDKAFEVAKVLQHFCMTLTIGGGGDLPEATQFTPWDMVKDKWGE